MRAPAAAAAFPAAAERPLTCASSQSGGGNRGVAAGVFGGVQHEGFLYYRVRAAGLLLTAAYLAFAAWLLLRPHYVTWVPSPNLRPFGTIREDLTMGPAHAARNLLAGLGLLAPLGVLLPMAGGRVETSGVASFLRTVFAGLMVSLSVEFTQTMVPGQLFDVDALILNTLGVALAHLLVVPAARARLRRRRTPPPAVPPSPLTPTGVGANLTP